MSLHRLVAVTVAAAALAGAGCGHDEQRLPASVLHAVESEPGFLLVPPGSALTSHGSRRTCVDASGDPPMTWRELDASDLPTASLDSFFRAQLPRYGWTTDVSEPPGVGPGAAPTWWRGFAGRRVRLSVWLAPHRVTVKAEVACAGHQ